MNRFNFCNDEIIEDLAFRLGIDPRNVGKILDYLRDYLIDELIEKGKVKFTGVGDFFVYEEIRPIVKKQGFCFRPHNVLNIVFYPSQNFLSCVLKRTKEVHFLSKKSRYIYTTKRIKDRTPQISVPYMEARRENLLTMKNIKSVKVANHLKKVLYHCYKNKDLIKQAMFKYNKREKIIEEFLNDEDLNDEEIILENEELETTNKDFDEIDNQDLANEVDEDLDEEEIEELFGENT